MDKLANMIAFEAVADTGSFAKAARQLNLSNSVISKRVKDLEDLLGAPLFARTTRQVMLTETGMEYAAYVRKLIEEMTVVEAGLSARTRQPQGTIRLTAPLSFGLQTLAPAIAAYLSRYPDVAIRTSLSDRRADLVSEGFDLAIRIGAMDETGLISKKLCGGRRVVCASPSYLATRGRPSQPSDLKSHNCLSYLHLAEGKSWPFILRGRKIWQPVSGNFLSDNGDLLHQAAVAGGGVALLPTFIIMESLKTKKLEILLEDYEEPDFDIHLAYQSKRHMSVTIRSFIDHLTETFRHSFDVDN